MKGHTVVAVFVNELSEAVTLAFGKVERTNSEGQVHVSFFLYRLLQSEALLFDLCHYALEGG